MEIPWLDMLIRFQNGHAQAALDRIRQERLGNIDASFGENGILKTGSSELIKIHAALPFLDEIEKFPGYLEWETVRQLRTHTSE
ncbi:MAG TPA: hypothetical protein VD862_02035 [Candidatus Paceibacterota bacterium]|nr:hypothetical protein [Candidatus Paceibacterota bacterium]